MTIHNSNQLRNVVLLGHGGSGKTSLAEALLFDTGAVNRLGRVDDGTSVADWDEEECRRKMSINMSLIPCEWQGHKLNMLDTPGYMDFTGEVIGAARVADSAVVVLDSVGGVEVGTEQVWHYANERNLPRLAFVNKMDRVGADFDWAVGRMRERAWRRLWALERIPEVGGWAAVHLGGLAEEPMARLFWTVARDREPSESRRSTGEDRLDRMPRRSPREDRPTSDRPAARVCATLASRPSG